MLGCLWRAIDKALWAEYPKLDNLLFSSWFIPLVIMVALCLPFILWHAI